MDFHGTVTLLSIKSNNHNQPINFICCWRKHTELKSVYKTPRVSFSELFTHDTLLCVNTPMCKFIKNILHKKRKI